MLESIVGTEKVGTRSASSSNNGSFREVLPVSATSHHVCRCCATASSMSPYMGKLVAPSSRQNNQMEITYVLGEPWAAGGRCCWPEGMGTVSYE